MMNRILACTVHLRLRHGGWPIHAIHAVLAVLTYTGAMTALANETTPPDPLMAYGARSAACQGEPVAGKDRQGTSAKVFEEGFVRVGGIEQWITIHGDNCANPVVLYLHGGPGNTISPYADAMYGAWERNFTMVQWDQRGAGKTFGRSPPAQETVLTLDQMVTDGLEVAQFLTQRLGQKKIILMGGSWSSVLAVHMVKRRPDLFHAYLGTAQLVSRHDNEAAFYAATLAGAEAAGDAAMVAALTAVGAPPWHNPRAFGIVRRASRRIEARSSTPAPAAWWRPAARYATQKALADYEQGEDYSWLQFVGLKGDGINTQVDLPKLGYQFDVPVFIVQGAHDLLTPVDVTQRYFDQLIAPHKLLVKVPLAGHDPNEALVDAQYRLLMEIKASVHTGPHRVTGLNRPV